MKQPVRKKLKNILVCIAISIGLLAIALIIDIGCFFMIPSNKLYEPDSGLGWRTKKNYIYTGTNHYDLAGKRYSVNITTNEHGFRSWGELKTAKRKILVIGDSFTGDAHMSDEDAYFEVMGELLDAEIFAYGGGGYGTLQELMVLKEFAPIIVPDIFVLQFCPNDFINNSFLLEGRSIVFPQKNLRPYLFKGSVKYRLAEYHPYRFFYKYSRIFRFIEGRIMKILFAIYDGYSPPLINLSAIEQQNEFEKNAKEITGVLLKEMTDTLPETTLAFIFNTATENQACWVTISKEAGFTPLPNVPSALESAELKGVAVRAADGGHWSPKGHHLIGTNLAKEILSHLGVVRK